MSKQYIVKTEIDTVTVEANSAREAVKMVAEGRKISGRSGKLTIRAGRSTISNVLVFYVRKSSDKFYRERWQVTEAPVEVAEIAEVAMVEVAAPAEVVAEQITVNAEQGQITLDIVSGATVEVMHFEVESTNRVLSYVYKVATLPEAYALASQLVHTSITVIIRSVAEEWDGREIITTIERMSRNN